MMAKIIEAFENQTEVLQESEMSLKNIIALQTTGFHRLLEAMKEDQGKDQLELTSNITGIIDGLETEIETEFQRTV